eukprot:1879289-Heterocapsa_arctica.AAC.1
MHLDYSTCRNEFGHGTHRAATPQLQSRPMGVGGGVVLGSPGGEIAGNRLGVVDKVPGGFI